MKATGQCLIVGVEVGELNVDCLGPAPRMSAKIAYTGENELERFGYTNRSTWSENTMAKLHALIRAINEEVISVTFAGGEAGAVVGGEPQYTKDGVPEL